MSDPIEVLRATAPHSESPLPWRANKRFIEDSNGYDVGGMGCREDAAHIAAAVNAAPVLLAEVDRLREELADERQAAMTIAAACLDTGVVPQGAVGTVDAVRAVCASADELRAQLAAAQDAVRHWHGSDHDNLCYALWPKSADPPRNGECNCGSFDNNRNRLEARLALGLEVPK